MWRRTSSKRIGLKSHPIVAPEAVEAARHRRSEDEGGLLVLVALEWAHHPDPVDQPLQAGRAGPQWFHCRVAQVDPEVVAEDHPETSSTRLDLVVLLVIKAVIIFATSCSLFAKASPRGSPLSPCVS